MARAYLAWLLLACLLKLDGFAAEPCTGTCVVKAERVTPHGRIPFDNTQPLVTAVGCLETIELTYGSNSEFGDNAAPPKTVLMISADQSTTITSSTVLDDSQEGLKNRICCREHPIDRDALLAEAGLLNEKCVTDQALALTPIDFFSCMMQYPSVKDEAAGTTVVRIQFIVPERADMAAGTTIDLMGQSDGSNSFLMQAEYEQVVAGQATSIKSAHFNVQVQIQRCSACLEQGEGLNSLAKRFGTHWTQVYSANHDIVGSPDELEQSRVLRVGSLYAVRERDTMMSIALKFGVTVNQLFKWNGHLRNELDTMPESPNHMSRALTQNQVLCVLPKTCHQSFGGSQPVFTQWEVNPGEGGSVGLKYQVEPPTPN